MKDCETEGYACVRTLKQFGMRFASYVSKGLLFFRKLQNLKYAITINFAIVHLSRKFISVRCTRERKPLLRCELFGVVYFYGGISDVQELFSNADYRLVGLRGNKIHVTILEAVSRDGSMYY